MFGKTKTPTLIAHVFDDRVNGITTEDDDENWYDKAEDQQAVCVGEVAWFLVRKIDIATICRHLKEIRWISFKENTQQLIFSL